MNGVGYFVSGLATGISLATIAFNVAVWGVPPQLLDPLFYRAGFLLCGMPILWAGHVLVFLRLDGGHISRPLAVFVALGWTMFVLTAMTWAGHLQGVR